VKRSPDPINDVFQLAPEEAAFYFGIDYRPFLPVSVRHHAWHLLTADTIWVCKEDFELFLPPYPCLNQKCQH